MLDKFFEDGHAKGIDLAEPEAAMLTGQWALPMQTTLSKAVDIAMSDGMGPENQYPKNPQTWLLLTLNALQSHSSSIRLSTLDMSCAFSVSDLRLQDMPLIYCSPTFELLTKYTLAEVEGRNHRFMQSPTGEQRAGEVREHTDNESVNRMMQDLSIGNETQVTLANYVKSHERWTNLLTMIPIVLNAQGTVDFYVGLQLNIDLFPENILRLPDGSFEIDYKVSPRIERPLSCPIEDESAITPYPFLEWTTMLNNEVTDTILTVSVLGHLLHISPSIRHLLGFEPEFLVGRHFAGLIHPADLPHVLQALNLTTGGTPLEFIARLRHFSGPFVWVSFAGRILETDMQQQIVVLSGRHYHFLGGPHFGGSISVQEYWCRISVDGIILFASSLAQRILGMSEEQLLGMHHTDLLLEQDRDAFTQAYSAARVGLSGTIEHNCMPTYGRMLRCRSDIFPGSHDMTRIQPFLLVRTAVLIGDIPTDHHDEETQSHSMPRSDAPATTREKDAPEPSLYPLTGAHIVSELVPQHNTSWQMELQQAEVTNRELRAAVNLARARKKAALASPVPRKHSNGTRNLECGICHARETTQWRTGANGMRLCNSCGLSWRKRSR